jgi:hypothetical protein
MLAGVEAEKNRESRLENAHLWRFLRLSFGDDFSFVLLTSSLPLSALETLVCATSLPVSKAALRSVESIPSTVIERMNFIA